MVKVCKGMPNIHELWIQGKEGFENYGNHLLANIVQKLVHIREAEIGPISIGNYDENIWNMPQKELKQQYLRVLKLEMGYF